VPEARELLLTRPCRRERSSPGRGARFKLQNLQVTGAYKVRGAFNAVAAQVSRGDRSPSRHRRGAAPNDLVIVEEETLAAAVASLALDDKVVAEGGGAASVAALPQVAGIRRIAVVSGGNIDAEVLARLI
jgi:threonine dehydratase